MPTSPSTCRRSRSDRRGPGIRRRRCGRGLARRTIRTVEPVRWSIVDIPTIDVATLAQEVAAGSPVIDVRQPDEYAEAHVPGVRLVPLAEVPERLDDVPRDRAVYVICRSGARSGKAVEFYRSQGIDAINVAGGTLAWVEAGHPYETGAVG